MLNYIKAELYRVFHRKYLYIALGLGVLAFVGMNFLTLIWKLNGWLDLPTGESAASYALALGSSLYVMVTYWCTCLLSDCVVSDERKNQTLKNTISYGISRTRIYFGKFLAELVLALLSAVLLYGLYMLSAIAFLGWGEGESMLRSLQLYGVHLLASFPIWLAGLAISHAIYSTVGGSVGTVLFLGLTLALPTFFILNLLGLWNGLQEYSKYFMLNLILDVPLLEKVSQTAPMWMVGLSWTGIALLVGWIPFSLRKIRE